MHLLRHPRYRRDARSTVLRAVSGEGRSWARTPRPSRPCGHARVAIGTPLTRCMLVRTDSPGLLLVHLHAAGLRVAVDGDAAQGRLRVHTKDAEEVRSVAAEHGIDVLDVHRLWLAPRPQ